MIQTEVKSYIAEGTFSPHHPNNSYRVTTHETLPLWTTSRMGDREIYGRIFLWFLGILSEISSCQMCVESWHFT